MPIRAIPWLVQCALAWALLPAAVGAAEAVPGEYDVKAVFIYNFSRFVEWPTSASAAMRLCVLGADPFGAALAAVENRPVGDRRFTSARIDLQSDAELRGCDILFIARSEHERLASLVQTVKGAPMLTVGDTPGYASQGVMINFYVEQGKVRFEINPHAAKLAGLKLSGKLLQLGRLVDARD